MFYNVGLVCPWKSATLFSIDELQLQNISPATSIHISPTNICLGDRYLCSLYFVRKLLDDWSFLPKLFSDLQVPVAPCQPPPRLNLPSLPSVVREAGNFSHIFFSQEFDMTRKVAIFFQVGEKTTTFSKQKKNIMFLSISPTELVKKGCRWLMPKDSIVHWCIIYLLCFSSVVHFNCIRGTCYLIVMEEHMLTASDSKSQSSRGPLKTRYYIYTN